MDDDLWAQEWDKAEETVWRPEDNYLKMDPARKARGAWEAEKSYKFQSVL